MFSFQSLENYTSNFFAMISIINSAITSKTVRKSDTEVIKLFVEFKRFRIVYLAIRFFDQNSISVCAYDRQRYRIYPCARTAVWGNF